MCSIQAVYFTFKCLLHECSCQNDLRVFTYRLYFNMLEIMGHSPSFPLILIGFQRNNLGWTQYKNMLIRLQLHEDKNLDCIECLAHSRL